MRTNAGRIVGLIALSLCGAASARATWSIILVDTENQEIAIGSATCLQFFDLQRGVPVLRVRVGAAAAQSFIDQSAQNRMFIWDELANGTDPAAILKELAVRDPAHQTRQYGIVDVLGRAATFSGSENGAYANGLTGRIGSIAYAIQGNVLTGQPVLDQAEAALRNTPGGIPEKLMAAMEAARAMGGDGRCSCSAGDPTGCGSPPPKFTKSAHIGFMIDARRGDIDGACVRRFGCATGVYFMNFNILSPNGDDRDPVIQLREQFDVWRTGLIGVPDASASRITVTPAALPADGTSTGTLSIEVRDWQGLPASGIQMVGAAHDWEGSAGSSTIGPIENLGNGDFRALLTAGTTTGQDNIVVLVQHTGGTTILTPDGKLLVHHNFGDLNGDGRLDGGDIDPLFLALGDPVLYQARFPDVAFRLVGDINHDGRFDAADIDPFFLLLGG